MPHTRPALPHSVRTLQHALSYEPAAVLLFEPVDLLQAASSQQVGGRLACSIGTGGKGAGQAGQAGRLAGAAAAWALQRQSGGEPGELICQ